MGRWLYTRVKEKFLHTFYLPQAIVCQSARYVVVVYQVSFFQSHFPVLDWLILFSVYIFVTATRTKSAWLATLYPFKSMKWSKSQWLCHNQAWLKNCRVKMVISTLVAANRKCLCIHRRKTLIMHFSTSWERDGTLTRFSFNCVPVLLVPLFIHYIQRKDPQVTYH